MKKQFFQYIYTAIYVFYATPVDSDALKKRKQTARVFLQTLVTDVVLAGIS